MKTIKGITAAALLLSAITVGAQEADNTSSKAISFGVKGGVNFSTITGDDFESPSSRTSFHVGALVEFPLTDMFSIQTEAMYSGQGFKYDVPGIDGNDHLEYQLDYLNVPILAKIYVTKGLSIDAGPQLGFKINEEYDADPGDNGGDTNSDRAKSFDFGVAGGLSFQTDMGLFATGRYVYGLTDVFEDVDAKNSVFQIGVGYKF